MVTPGFPISTPAGRRRVAVTGMGIITSMGNGCSANAEGFRQGRMALKPITLFDASRQRVQRAGEVDLPAELPATLLKSAQRRRVERSTALVLHAACEAWSQAGLSLGAWQESRVPLVLGTSAGAMEVGEDYYKQAVANPQAKRGQAVRVMQYQIKTQASLVAAALGLSGPITIISNACASGANSIGHALEEIRAGRADAAVCGGYDALAEMVFAGFDSLQALSTDLPRPFDAARDGLALGEGAAIFVLESFEHAQARGAVILAELCGYGAATDLHHLTQPHPQGDAALAAMQEACVQAEVVPSDIGYINSHGTGTPLNDVAEANAIVRWAGPAEGARTIAVSSTKAAIGHLLGGAGSVEAVICVLALRGGWLPPTPNIRELDAACQFDVVQSPRDQTVDFCLTNSFGFGGANATLVFGRPERYAGLGSQGVKWLKTTGRAPVRVAGVGCVSPAGWGVERFLQALAAGEPLPVQVVEPFVGASAITQRGVPAPAAPLAFLREPRLRRVSPLGKYLAAAALEAMAGHLPLAPDFRLGVVFAVFNGCVNYSRRFFAEVLSDPKTASPILFPETVFNAPASHLSSLFRSTAINYTVVAGLDCFHDGLKLAENWLADGRVDGVLVAAAEELDWLSGQALSLLQPGEIPAEGAVAAFLSADPVAGEMLWGDAATEKADRVKRVFGHGLGVSAGWEYLAKAPHLAI